MKVRIDIDCTPEEARKFLGLPEVAPMQEAIMEELRKQMMSNLQAMDPESLWKSWFPATLKGWDQLLSVMRTAGSSGASDSKDGEDG